ncbi:MAG: hypothetical protein DRN01_05535 [Thermoplasmata archaeon]|nr:MAG: hypothetical protein DRN01_05535 [Thermoplasmata archaeon]
MNLRPLAKLLVKRPKMVLLIFTVAVFIIGSQATNLYMTSDLSVYLPKGEHTIELLGKVEQQWNLGDTMIIYVESSNVLDPKVLKDIDYVTNAVNTYRHDNGEIDGVISVTSIVSLIKQENSLSPPFGTGKYELPTSEHLIKKYVAQIGDMRKSVLTDDLTATAVTFILTKDADGTAILGRAENAVKTVNTQMTLIGSLPQNVAMEERSLRNMAIIFPLAIIFVSIVLFFFHRTMKGLIIAFLPPAFAIILTFGVLGVVAPELTMLSIAIVALLIGLGVDYSIHLMNRLLEEREQDVVTKVENVLKTTGKAVLLSTITTMVGFGSLMISTMSPMINFGFGCTLGIFFAFLSATILVPCLVLILRFEKKSKILGWKRLAKFASKNSKKILILGCAVAFLSLAVLPEVNTDVNYSELVPQGEPVIEKTKEFSERFGTRGNIDIILVEANLKDPEVLKTIDAMEERLRDKGIEVYSIVDTIKKINLGRMPENQMMIDLIYSAMMKQADGFIDEDFSRTLISVNIPADLSMEELERTVNEINNVIHSTNIPGGVVYDITGSAAINVAINNLLFEQQSRSLFISLLFVFATLIIIFRSSLYSIITMIPIVFVLTWEPGILVTMDIPLSVITITIASIIVGTGVDYGVHITQRVREGLHQGLDKEKAIENAIEKTGLSLVEAALTTVAGLLSVYFVNVPGLQEFMKVVISMIILSLISAVFILPAFYKLRSVK